MFQRSLERRRDGGTQGVLAVVAYLSLTCLLGLSSLYALQTLIGGVIVELPAPIADNGINRVERWANLGEIRPNSPTTAVGNWFARTETSKPSIPMTAILESETQGSETLAEFSNDGTSRACDADCRIWR